MSFDTIFEASANTTVIGDGCIVRKEERFEHTDLKVGHIYVPKSSTLSVREAKIGRLVAVGPGVYNKRNQLVTDDVIQPGKLCYYARYGGDRFSTLDGKYIKLSTKGILAIVDDVPEDLVSPTLDMIQPLDDRIIVKPLEINQRTTTKSGLVVIQDKERDLVSVLSYVVVKLGTGRLFRETLQRKPFYVKVGDLVTANLLSGAEFSLYSDSISHGLDNYRLLSEMDILTYDDAYVAEA